MLSENRYQVVCWQVCRSGTPRSCLLNRALGPCHGEDAPVEQVKAQEPRRPAWAGTLTLPQGLWLQVQGKPGEKGAQGAPGGALGKEQGKDHHAAASPPIFIVRRANAPLDGYFKSKTEASVGRRQRIGALVQCTWGCAGAAGEMHVHLR